ncbi:hypothetical protein FHS61_002137 [Altererythrobacter atlanticus]|uniref:Uncharacterized protein n=1 Tax=Croceibacterium atlanticum TaxID=1267766 RepID=A0A0F7KR30_9SPHN|nr:DUF1178 family protein [Croceibacterium atlanticum]AKH41647.1 hypothetical protein WYH_00591 [Croceibacterium atlanticum]MBB5733111.1 hypothetical protein [Croceibacterium atlanticum]
MIVYDLNCDSGHRFEGWFGSSEDYDRQYQAGLLTCPHCGSAVVNKAPMAAAVPRKGNQQGAIRQSAESAGAEQRDVSNVPLTPEVAQALEKLAQAQAKALEKSTWVGNAFAEQSRAMHYGEQDAKAIHGQASLEEAKALIDEGIEIAPLPFPIAPPDELN